MRPAAILISDWDGLNFLNSVATPVDTVVDWIDDGEGLLSWLEQAHLVPTEALARIRSVALPGELDKVADQARSLREWFRGVVQKHRGQPLNAEVLAELEPLNRLLERDEAFRRIVLQPVSDKSACLELQFMRRWRSPESLLLPIGEALAQFVCNADFSKVKGCEGATCTLFFVDQTRGTARRWCSMAICGNRAKQSAHRRRFKESEQQ